MADVMPQADATALTESTAEHRSSADPLLLHLQTSVNQSSPDYNIHYITSVNPLKCYSQKTTVQKLWKPTSELVAQGVFVLVF
jgi:hypothetical protein